MKTKTTCWICAVLLLVLIVLQFIPFWHYGEPEKATSINGYVWMPTDHTDLEKWLASEAEGANVTAGHLVLMPLLVLVLGVAAIILCFVQSDNVYSLLAPGVAGCIGAIGYLKEAALHLGSNWGIHLTLCIVIVLLAAGGFICGIRERKQ